MPHGVDQPDEGDQARRVKATLACMSLLRVLHAAIELYDADLEAFVVYIAVACSSVGGAMRDPEVAYRTQDGPAPESVFRPVSRRAIAASTGLPRETVRRKISQMVERGFLVEEQRGVRTRPGVLSERRNSEFVAVAIREIQRASAELARADRAFEPR